METTLVHSSNHFKVAHVLVTISKFEDIKQQLEDLKRKQLQSGEENIAKVVHSLQARENQLAKELQRISSYELEEINKVYLDIIRKQALETGVSSEFVLNTATHTGKIVALKYFIEKEQNLLKIWTKEQISVISPILVYNNS